MKFARIGIVFLLLIISLGAVSAADEINDVAISHGNSNAPGEGAIDDAILQGTQNGEYGINEINNTFTDLQKDIDASVNVVNIEHDYKFNNETDKKSIVIETDNFTINGNNKIIDGNNQTRILLVAAKNVTINNLVFINGNCKDGSLLLYDGGGAIVNLGSLTLNNVTFIDNSANYDGGDILTDNAQLSCFDCTFIDSHSVNGNSIYASNSIVDIERSTFTSKYYHFWSSVYAKGCELLVDNCLFTNISSGYASAIFAENGYVTINNTKFKNLRADYTAGAVGIKACELITIENCIFTNTSAVKNGGALFIDAFGDHAVDMSSTNIVNVTFNNALSSFGGAFLQLNGNLTVMDSTFTNCSSFYDGGAVYLSLANTQFVNCRFDSNNATSHDNYATYGGALYFDYCCLDMTDCEFENNVAPIGSAIFIYDSQYHLDNVTLNNNGNAVYTFFDKDSSTVGSIKGNDKISPDDLNNTYYPNLIVGEGMKLNLTTNTIDLTILPTRFDLREIGWITPMRDQGNMGSCWTFGAMDALESALVKNTGIFYSLSENNLQDAMLIYSKYGCNALESDFETDAAAYLLNWFGAFPQEYDSYDQLGKVSPLIHTNQTIHVQDYILLERNVTTPGDPVIKLAILKYGVLSIVFDAAAKDVLTYNFYSNSTDPDHAVGLVGWDDNYPKENFDITPPGDGAWIIKNSWGAEWGEEGYGYISYYDKSFLPSNNISDQAVAFVIENTLPYNKNYQYDFTGLDAFMTYEPGEELYGSQITNVNNFVSEGNDLIAAVGTYFNQSGIDYTVKIAVNGVVVYTQKGVSPYRGYHTIKLNKYVPIKKGDKFSIYLTSVELGMSTPVRIHYDDGVSMTNYGGTWKDVNKEYGTIACIKAYTLKDDSVITANKNITVDYAGGSYFSVKVTTADGHAVVGGSVKFSIAGNNYVVKSDSNGIAKIKITQVPKKYTITTTFNGKSVNNTVTVKQVLKTSKVTVKKTAKKFTLKATLKINGKLQKGKWITFKLNGKNYKVKTNAKGIAQKSFNKNFIKKLKKGKTYAVAVTYGKDTIKTTLKVSR